MRSLMILLAMFFTLLFCNYNTSFAQIPTCKQAFEELFSPDDFTELLNTVIRHQKSVEEKTAEMNARAYNHYSNNTHSAITKKRGANDDKYIKRKKELNPTKIVPAFDALMLYNRSESIARFKELCNLMELEQANQTMQQILVEYLKSICGNNFFGAILNVSPGINIKTNVQDTDDIEIMGLLNKPQNALYGIVMSFNNELLFNRLIDEFDSKYEYFDSKQSRNSIEHVFVHNISGQRIMLILGQYNIKPAKKFELSYTILNNK